MNLHGHDELWREWRDAMASARMHHGWILSGPEGVGKGAFARAAARELLCEPGIPQPEGEHHPDVLLIDPLPANDDEEKKRDEGKPFLLKRNISVDQIRRMQRRLTTRATLGSRRAVIVDSADDLEKSAANALLKALEEPPQGTFFLLISHRPGRLLPTIRSRCRMLRFAPLDDVMMEQALRDAVPGASGDARKAAIAAAEGSPGAALRFVEADLGTIHALMLRILREGDKTLSLRGALGNEIGPRPDRVRQLAALDMARSALGSELANKSRDGQLRIINAHASLTQLAAQATTYNFDAGLLMTEIGTLLASAAMPRDSG